MAWNANVPAVGNQILEDIADIEENLELVIQGDGTEGRVLRSGYITITGEADAEITCQLFSLWNGDTDGPEANIQDSETSGNWTMGANGAVVTLAAAALSGNAIAAWGNIWTSSAAGAYAKTCYVRASGNNLVFSFYHAEAGSVYDLTGMAAGEVISVQVTYITAT